MLNELNYLSPVCRLITVCSEGVLCGSVDSFDTMSTETFDSIKDFEW